MADRKVILHKYNGTGYDNLYPKTTISQVQNLQAELDSKQGDLTEILSYDNDKYLHTNPNTGALEWADAGKVDDVKVDGTSVVTDKVASIDLATPLATKQNKIFVQASQPSSFVAGDIWYDLVGTFSITPTLTHCTGSASNPTTITEGGTANLTYTADAGYNLPDSITVTNAMSSWTKSTGALVLSNAINNVSITINATPIPSYNITTTLTNCTGAAENPTTILEGGTATLTFTANTGYELPDSIVVIGATSNWTKSTGTLILSNPTSAVSVTINAEAAKLPVGGRIFYIHNDNGATYRFFDAQNNELTTQTVAGLENAAKYTVAGTPSADKFYVYNTTIQDNVRWGKSSTSFNVTTNTIGSGKPNSAICLAATGWESDSIWTYINTCNTNSVGGCNDWYIASQAEQDQLRSSSLVDWYSNKYMWASIDEAMGAMTFAHYWDYNSSNWGSGSKDNNVNSCFACRSF